MKRLLFIFLTALGMLGACSPAAEQSPFRYRWVYVSMNPADSSQVEQLRQVARDAAEHGFNGVLLSAGLYRLDVRGPEYFKGLEEVKKICADSRLEIIPSVFSVGYGSGLAQNKNLAAGMPVREALFVAQVDQASLVSDPLVEIPNGGFEKLQGTRAAGFEYPDSSDKKIIADKSVFKEGRAALRFESLSDKRGESSRVSRNVAVQPFRPYRIGFWLKTEGLDIDGTKFRGGSFNGNIRLLVYGASDHRELLRFDPRVAATSDWTWVCAGFNSLGYDSVEVALAGAAKPEAKFWADGLKLEEAGLANILRRPGTPLTVRGEKSGTIYEEGRDFAEVSDPQLDCYFDHDGPAIHLLPGGRIKPGERLRVSYYHGMAVPVNKHQITVCMSEPELYEIWRKQVSLIQEHLAPKAYFLPQDEIRNGGWCKACTDRNMTMGQILSDCITRQYNIIKEANPQAEVFIWSDMLDPNHNAGPRVGKYYYMVNGLFDGSWNYVPKDLVIAVWGRSLRDKSLEHFSGLGFRTLGAIYYDADDLEDVPGCLEALEKTPSACGVMYTTWEDKYSLLGQFGDLVAGKK